MPWTNARKGGAVARFRNPPIVPRFQGMLTIFLDMKDCTFTAIQSYQPASLLETNLTVAEEEMLAESVHFTEEEMTQLGITRQKMCRRLLEDASISSDDE